MSVCVCPYSQSCGYKAVHVELLSCSLSSFSILHLISLTWQDTGHCCTGQAPVQ